MLSRSLNENSDSCPECTGKLLETGVTEADAKEKSNQFPPKVESKQFPACSSSNCPSEWQKITDDLIKLPSIYMNQLIEQKRKSKTGIASGKGIQSKQENKQAEQHLSSSSSAAKPENSTESTAAKLIYTISTGIQDTQNLFKGIIRKVSGPSESGPLLIQCDSDNEAETSDDNIISL